MVATPTQTGIVNRAAEMLGSTARITSITQQNSNVALHARAAWDTVVRTALDEFGGAFSIRRGLLNEAADAPLFGWQRAFTLPPECLRWLPPAEGDDEYFIGVQEENSILTNAVAPLPVRFVSAEAADNVAIWPAAFVAVIEARMAEAMAEPLTQSESTAEKMGELAMALMRKAKRKDAQARGNVPRRPIASRSNWAASRYRPFRLWDR